MLLYSKMFTSHLPQWLHKTKETETKEVAYLNNAQSHFFFTNRLLLWGLFILQKPKESQD